MDLATMLATASSTAGDGADDGDDGGVRQRPPQRRRLATARRRRHPATADLATAQRQLTTVTALVPTAAASGNDDFNCSNGISTTMVAERERGRGMLSAWDPQLARLFWLAKFGQWEEDFGQPDGLAIRIASLLEGEIEPKLPKFNLVRGIRRLLEMLLVGEKKLFLVSHRMFDRILEGVFIYE
ncbi:hypothetical protein OsI_23908 [Oryza sativa Indica Group]|uniref:Disease resistance protein-like n=2 Tax=Oryza sativa TaxID=4530 RepID=Q67WY7_ORYSJ|nr:hypothetical protein OsI_23908 [Oryza sativa Indica Group]EAZ37825.1 hypothetical protein OsJ_22166 [Oryza sativa Japonica Group]BAD37332.1 disease resistance protein-like [Oryza sativa Japonica Group]